MFDFTIIARPHTVMPVGNPIQYVFETDRTTRAEVDYYTCAVTGLQYSYFDNNILNMDIGSGAPATLSSITIAGDTYVFIPCADVASADSPYYINLSPYLASGDFCDLAAEIINAINNNPDAQGRYFAMPIGSTLDIAPPGVVFSPASSCDPTSLTIRVIANRIDLDLNVTQSAGNWPGYAGGTPWLGPTSTPARNYFTNYRMYLYAYEESGDYRFGAFAQSKKLTALPVPAVDNINAPVRLWIDPVRRFVFDLSAQLRSYLGHDVPGISETKVRACFRCLKIYSIVYGDQKDGVGDGTTLDPAVQVSKFQADNDLPDGELIVLNAWLPIYDSDFAARETDTGASCVTTESAPYLLERYFYYDTTPRDFLYVTESNTENACGDVINRIRHHEGQPLWLHWWTGFDFEISSGLMKLWARYHYDDGSTVETDTGFDFADIGNCETMGADSLQLLQIPAHAALSLAAVESFEVWIEYDGAVVSNELSFVNYEACDSMVGLCFVTRFGVFQCAYFEGDAVLMSTRESESYLATRLGLSTPRHAPHNRGETTHYVTARRVWDCKILLTGVEPKDVMLDLMLSPDVRLIWNGELLPVTISTNDLQLMQSTSGEIDEVEFTVMETGERYG